MATRGRPKKPKLVTVKAAKGIPSCPAALSREGKAEWKRVTKELDAMGLLAKVDRGALTAYCEAWEEFVLLLKKVRSEGPVVYTDKGNAIQNPTLGAKNNAAQRVMKFAAQFGMTPVARAKLETKEQGDDDAFAAFAGLRVVNG